MPARDANGATEWPRRSTTSARSQDVFPRGETLLTARTEREAQGRARADTAWNEVMRDQTGLDHLIVNTKKPPFDNAKVREAVSWAIDRRGLIAGPRGLHGP